MRTEPSLQPREREKINWGHMDEINNDMHKRKGIYNAMNDPKVETSGGNPSGAFPRQCKRLAGLNIALGRRGRE